MFVFFRCNIITVHINSLHVCTHSVNITLSNKENNTVPGMFDIDTYLHIEREKERDSNLNIGSFNKKKLCSLEKKTLPNILNFFSLYFAL